MILAVNRARNVRVMTLPMAKPNQQKTLKMQAGMAAIPIVIQIPKMTDKKAEKRMIKTEKVMN